MYVLSQLAAPSARLSRGDPTKDTAGVAIDTVAQTLSAVISAYDQQTGTHTQRLVHLSEATARQLEQSEDEIRLIGLAARLHDLGKTGVPDAILHKPAPLTEEEWGIMRRHPDIGGQMLVQIGEVFGRLADSVRAHHERWEGRGYPYGRAQAAIPLSARILAVVDAYDAMTSPRPYRRNPLSVMEAKAELQRFAGSQFEPRVVEAFLSVLAEQETTQRLLEEANASGMSGRPPSTMRVITGTGWREQTEEWRQQQVTVQRRKEILQRQKEILQQQRHYLGWQKQQGERQRDEQQ